MLQFSLFFTLGTIWLHLQPELALTGLLIPVCLFACWRLLPRSIYRLPWALIAAFMLGFSWAFIYAQFQLSHDLHPDQEGHELLISGYIADLPVQDEFGQRFIFNVEHCETVVPRKIELTWYLPAPKVQAGQRWQLLVQLKRRHGFANPGGYDYELQLFREGIGATGYVRASHANRFLGYKQGTSILRARQALTNKIAEAIPDSLMQGVIRGLAVGDQRAIPRAAWHVFARTGTSHLMAISGFHIGMVAMVFAWMGSALVYLPVAQRWRLTTIDLKAGFGLTGAFGYSLLAGMSLPTERTLIMLTVYFASRWYRREIHVWHNFGLALLLVQIFDPLATLSVGAWLSFGAVAVILINQHGRLTYRSGWQGFVSLQMIVTLGLIPLLLACFGNLSIVSPLVNLLAIPLVTVIIVPAVLIACLLLVLSCDAGTTCLFWISRCLDWLYGLLEWTSHLPWASCFFPNKPVWVMAVLVVGTLMMIIPWLWSLRLVGALMCFSVFIWPVTVPANGEFELTTLDVGQGLSVAIRTHAHVLVFDTGPSFKGGGNTGDMVVLPFLRSQGIHRLDILMLSHGDSDHVGGAKSLMAEMPVTTVLAGPSVNSFPNIQRCQRGQKWDWDEVHFVVLHPQIDTSDGSDNNVSCVLQVMSRSGSALILGDVEKSAEAELVSAGLVQPANLVVAAHHGSRTSSTSELIAASQPDQQRQWVVFSTGYRNRWGFPKSDIVDRWKQVGAHPLNTASDGAISLKVSPSNPTFEPTVWRSSHRRYWQAEHPQLFK